MAGSGHDLARGSYLKSAYYKSVLSRRLVEQEPPAGGDGARSLVRETSAAQTDVECFLHQCIELWIAEAR